jgi:hypothetical protein
MRWAQDQGCVVNSGYCKAPDGTMQPITRFERVSDDGTIWFDVEIGTEQWENLAPTTVGRLDRQLGLKSPYPSIP